MLNKFQKLKNINEGSIETFNKWNKAFITPPLEEERIIFSRGPGIVWYDYQRFALESFFVNADTESTKQHFYTCGKLDVFLITKYDEKILDYGINHLSYALLSDSNDLIFRYANLRHSNYEKAINSGGTAPTYILQCLIKEDWAEYERAMEIMKTKTLKKLPMQLDMAFYQALAEKNKEKIEQVLAEFVTPKIHKQRNRYHELINEFISHPALGYAKLAWMKGIQVEVNSPLVPKELLHIKPLEKYKNEYNFLNDLPLREN